MTQSTHDGDTTASVNVSTEPDHVITAVGIADKLTKIVEAIEDKLRTQNEIVRIFMAELVGTMFLVCLGDAAIAQSVLSRGEKGTFLTINLAFAFAVAFGVYICGGVSGGHINPAITLAMCVLRRCKWTLLPIYWLAQFIGAFLGAALIYGAYKCAMDNFDGGIRQVYGDNATAGIFASYPASFVTVGTGLFDQILGTGILACVVLALTDPRNAEVPKHMVPLLVGLTVGLIGMSFGMNCGFPISPARDLGPRFFTLMAGWGVEVFSYRGYNWFWVPIIGPLFGAVLGAMVYQVFVGIHWPTEKVRSDYSVSTPMRSRQTIDIPLYTSR